MEKKGADDDHIDCKSQSKDYDSKSVDADIKLVYEKG
jgi:hypothetical protein